VAQLWDGMADEDEEGRCALCGGPVGKDGRTTVPVRPPRKPVSLPPTPSRGATDSPDDGLTPAERFERAKKRRDAVASKVHGDRAKGGDPAD
jgi:hypothetical protein